MLFRGIKFDIQTISYFIYEVVILVDKGFKEQIRKVNEEMQEGRIIDYLSRKYDDFDGMHFLIEESDKNSNIRKKAINMLLQEYSCNFSGKEARKWGIENNGLCVLISWSVEMMRDWKITEEILRDKE